MQLKFGLSYIAVIAAVLLLLNTYPLLVSEDLVFRSKETTMQGSVSVMVYSLSGLDKLNPENVSAAMAVVEETGLSRVLVTDSAGQVLYDTRETLGAVGKYTFYSEIVQALEGYDAFSCAYRDGAFRSRAASPVLYQNRIIGSVYAYEYDTEQAALLEGLQSNLLKLSGIIALSVVVLSFILSRMLTRKIGALLTAIRQVREGSYEHRTHIPGHDEIAQIGEEFNSLTDRLQTTEDLRRRFVSDASHELKTPLAAIRLLTDSILQTDNMDMATVRDFVTDIGSEAQRLSSITEDLLRLTRLDSGLVDKPKRVEVVPVLEQVMRMMSFLAQDKGTELTYQAEEGCAVMATRGEVHQVIYNLTDNAVKYSGSHGSVRVELRRLRVHWDMLKKIVRVGIPAALQMAVTAFSNVFVQSYINHFGADCMSGWTAYTKIDQLMFLPMQSLALSATTFVGQNLGAGDTPRAQQGVRRALGISLAVTAVLMVPVLVFAPQLTAFFNRKAEVVAYGTLLLRYISPFYLLCCINQIYSGALRGAGNSQVPMVIMLGSFVVFRQIYLYIVSHFITNTLLPLAMGYPAGWLVCSAATLLYYRRAALGRQRLVEDN